MDRCFALFILRLVISAQTYDNVIRMKGWVMVWFRDLIFDDWNKEHIARHGIEWGEATEAVRNSAFMTRGRSGTYQLIGQTDPGRFLAIVLAPRGQGVYYVVTAREATREEQRRYRRR